MVMTWSLWWTSIALFALNSFTSAEIKLKELAAFDLGITSESIEFDDDNNVYWIGNWNNATMDSITSNIDTLESGSNSYKSDSSFNIKSAVSYNFNALNYGNVSGNGATGMVAYGGFLYVANTLTGIISKFNISAKNLVTTYTVTYLNTGIAAQTDGLCIDYDYPWMLYTTDWGEYGDSGRYGIWSINTNSSTVTQIYWYNSSDSSQYKLRPNGCIIKSGVLYVVETRAEFTGLLAMYNIAAKTWTYDDSLQYMGDGIVIDNNNNFFITSWNKPGGSLSFGNGMIIGRQSNSNKWNILVSGLWSGSDMSYDSTNDILAVADYYSPSNYYRFYSIETSNIGSSIGKSKFMLLLHSMFIMIGLSFFI